MSSRQFETTARAKLAPQAKTPEAERAPAVQHDHLTSTGSGATNDARSQAAPLGQASGGQLAQAGSSLLQLQRSYGNRYVQGVVDRAAPAPVIQTKLMLGPADDRYEREADWVAQQVASGAGGPALDADSRAPAIQCLASAQGGAVDAGVQQAIQGARGGGQPLPDHVRGSMEQALGADFSGVRVHTDAQADQLNRSLQARAFTTGQDIFLRRGEYSPGNSGGRELLAHELTHVVQQSGKSQLESSIQPAKGHLSAPFGIQRQIYQYTDGKWYPNNEASKSLNNEQGNFYNDRTKKYGNKLVDVTEDLSDLLMNTGKLADIMNETSWDKLGKDLKKPFMNGKYGEYTVVLGEILVDSAEQWDWKGWTGTYPKWWKKVAPNEPEIRGNLGVEKDDLTKTIKSLMEANGQMAYIRQQPWFKNREYKLAIEVNYYPARPLSDTSVLEFHKDTGGNNIFVNLLFNNDLEIPATEWFVDAAKPSAERKDWQSKVLPKGHLEKVAKAQAELGNKDQMVHGGVMGKNAYVSWVDDLIWHSTPQMSKRKTTTVEEIMKNYKELPNENYINNTTKRSWWYEILLIISETPDTWLVTWLEQQGNEKKFIDYKLMSGAWRYLYRKGNKVTEGRLEADVGKVDWAKVRLGSLVGEAIAKDSRLEEKGSKSISEPTGLGSLERENELDATLAKVKKAHEESTKKGETRSFIRTWVRIVPAK